MQYFVWEVFWLAVRWAFLLTAVPVAGALTVLTVLNGWDSIVSNVGVLWTVGRAAW